MDAELKAKWVAALRSDRYKQGMHYLRCGDETFCCLGVLGDIAAPERWSKLGDEPAWNFGAERTLAMILLPTELVSGDIQDKLTAMNDGQKEWHGNRQSFEQIADWIEKNL
jgi:hypothetical protein